MSVRITWRVLCQIIDGGFTLTVLYGQILHRWWTRLHVRAANWMSMSHQDSFFSETAGPSCCCVIESLLIESCPGSLSLATSHLPHYKHTVIGIQSGSWEPHTHFRVQHKFSESIQCFIRAVSLWTLPHLFVFVQYLLLGSTRCPFTPDKRSSLSYLCLTLVEEYYTDSSMGREHQPCLVIIVSFVGFTELLWNVIVQ